MAEIYVNNSGLPNVVVKFDAEKTTEHILDRTRELDKEEVKKIKKEIKEGLWHKVKTLEDGAGYQFVFDTDYMDEEK